jgi:predicted nucleic acid-binding Zn finger protein
VTTKFLDRKNEANRLVSEDRVKKYLINGIIERWVVVGNKRNYLVMSNPFWCRCYDFQNEVLNDRIAMCKHTLAVLIAQREKKYEVFEVNKEEYDFIREELIL